MCDANRLKFTDDEDGLIMEIVHRESIGDFVLVVNEAEVAVADRETMTEIRDWLNEVM